MTARFPIQAPLEDTRSNSVTAAAVPFPGANGVLMGLALVATLYFGRVIFVPLAIAILLTFLLAPPVRLLRSWRFGRVLSVVTVVLLAFLIIFGLGAVLGQQVAQLAEKLPQYEITIKQKIQTFQGVATSSVTLEQASNMLKDLRREIGKIPGESGASSPATGSASNGERSPTPPIPVEIRQPDPGPLQVLQRVIDPLLGPLTTTGIIVIFVIFILLQREDLRDRLIKLAGSHDLQRTTAAIDDAARRLSRYFLAQTALNAVFGLVVGIGLAFIGIPSPVLWGILAMVLRFVPYIGAFIAAAFPLALAASIDPGWSMVLWTLGLFLVVEPILGQAIEPMVYGQSTGISPVAVVIAATFWTWLWGPIGLLLSTPMTVCLGVLGRHVDQLQFLDVVFGDRPPLSPAQSFYQRMLAGDPDEAVTQAEAILKDTSLSKYYDEVALQGLRLAQIDANRGFLDEARLVQIRGAVEELVDDLADYDDVDPDKGFASPVSDAEPDGSKARDIPVLRAEDLPPEWRGEQPVLCIAGRSALDAAAATMLVQILEKHGIGARLESQETVLSSRVVQLDGVGVRMICLAYLDVGNSAARLRNSIRRLRRKIPAATILACLWGHEGDESEQEALRAELGADLYASSLRRAVRMCVDAARTPIAEKPPARTAEMQTNAA